MCGSLCAAGFPKSCQTVSTLLAKQLRRGGQTQQCKQLQHLAWGHDVSHMKAVSSKKNVQSEKLVSVLHLTTKIEKGTLITNTLSQEAVS